MELYVHVPFCVRKCNYCDFLSFPGYGDGADEKHRSILSGYLDRLNKELKETTDSFCSVRNLNPVTSCFIGGGTPSVLGNQETENLLNGIRQCIDASYQGREVHKEIEFTIECNPGTVNPEKLKIYKEYGVNRLSFGLQSADDGILKRLGRIHSYNDFLESYHLSRSLGFRNINVDLISAVPGQNVSNWEETLKKVVALSPEHISAYSLIIEEGTPFYTDYKKNPESLDLPDEIAERNIYHMTGEFLGKNGYNRYEISNYSKKGYECRHNIGYWTGEEYLGLGLGASSYISAENKDLFKRNAGKCTGNIKECGSNAMFRIRNTEDIRLYLEGDGISRIEEVLSLSGMKSEFCILGLRMTAGISFEEYRLRFGSDMADDFGLIIDKGIKRGLLEENGGRLYFTERGLDLSNTILCDFL